MIFELNAKFQMQWMYCWNRNRIELTLLTHQPCEVDKPNCFCYKYVVLCDVDGQIESSDVLSTTFHTCHVWKFKTCFLEFLVNSSSISLFLNCTYSLACASISLVAYKEIFCLACCYVDRKECLTQCCVGSVSIAL